MFSRICLKNEDLVKQVSFRYYKDKDIVNHYLIKDYNKMAYCKKKGNEIYISELVCKASESIIYRVILHEMVHLTYTNMSEDDVMAETDKRFAKTAGLWNII